MTRKVLQLLLLGLSVLSLPILATAFIVWTSNILLGLDWAEESRYGLLFVCYVVNTFFTFVVGVENSEKW